MTPSEAEARLGLLRVDATPAEQRRIDLMLSGVCEYPDCEMSGEVSPQNTSYEKELSNWCCLCPEHMEENDLRWEEMWAEYRAGCL